MKQLCSGFAKRACEEGRTGGAESKGGCHGGACECRKYILSTEDTPCILCVYEHTRWRSGSHSAMLTLTAYCVPGALLSTRVNSLILSSGLML